MYLTPPPNTFQSTAALQNPWLFKSLVNLRAVKLLVASCELRAASCDRVVPNPNPNSQLAARSSQLHSSQITCSPCLTFRILCTRYNLCNCLLSYIKPSLMLQTSQLFRITFIPGRNQTLGNLYCKQIS